MFCSNCGSRVGDGERFCVECGHSLQQGNNNTIQQANTFPQNNNIQPNNNYTAVNDKWAWSLAAVPLLNTFVMIPLLWVIIFGAAYTVGGMGIIVTLIASFVVMVVLNIIFIVKDVKELEKHGVSISGGIFLGLFLVPVYLFMRANKLKQNYGYAVLWCFGFVISLIL